MKPPRVSVVSGRTKIHLRLFLQAAPELMKCQGSFLPAFEGCFRDWLTLGMRVQLLSPVWLSATPWVVPHQALLSRDFPGKNAAAACHFFLRGSSWSRDQTCIFCVSYIGRQILHRCKVLFWISAKIFVQKVFRKTDLLLLDHHSLCLWSTLGFVYVCWSLTPRKNKTPFIPSCTHIKF